MKCQSIKYERAKHEIEMQRFLTRFICLWLSFSCTAALILFYLQGFHLWGFGLDKDLLHLIAMTTIGAIGSLAATVYATFVKKGEVLPRRQLAPHSSADLNTASKKKLL